jgi:hypothetical protein
MRLLPLLFCLALGACVTDGAPAPGDARAVPAAAAAAPARPEKPKPKEWWEEGPVTRERASAMCWLKVEKANRDAPLDRRAELVGRCVNQALKEHGAPAGPMR